MNDDEVISEQAGVAVADGLAIQLPPNTINLLMARCLVTPISIYGTSSRG
jgi:hypothetical protein